MKTLKKNLIIAMLVTAFGVPAAFAEDAVGAKDAAKGKKVDCSGMAGNQDKGELGSSGSGTGSATGTTTGTGK